MYGPVRLAIDVEALVLDPCYRETDVEALARRLPCPIEWRYLARFGDRTDASDVITR